MQRGSNQRKPGGHNARNPAASREIVRGLVQEAANAVGGHKFGVQFLLTEWEQVVDALRLESWEEYRDVVRLGRKTRLPEAQRTVLWSIFEHIRSGLRERKLITHAELFTALAVAIAANKNAAFDFAVVDCRRRLNFDPPCRSNIDPGTGAAVGTSGCG